MPIFSRPHTTPLGGNYYDAEGLKGQAPGQRISVDQDYINLYGMPGQEVLRDQTMAPPIGTPMDDTPQTKGNKIQVQQKEKPDGSNELKITDPISKATATAKTDQYGQKTVEKKFEATPQEAAEQMGAGVDWSQLSMKPFMQIWDWGYGTPFAKDVPDMHQVRAQQAQANVMNANALRARIAAGTPDMRAEELELKRLGLELDRDKLERAISGELDPLQAAKLKYIKARTIEALRPPSGNTFMDKLLKRDEIKQRGEERKEKREQDKIEAKHSIPTMGIYFRGGYKMDPKVARRLKGLPADTLKILENVDGMREIINKYPRLSGFRATKAQGKYFSLRNEIVDIIKRVEEYGALQKAEFDFISKKIGPGPNEKQAVIDEYLRGLDARKGMFDQFQRSTMRELRYSLESNDLIIEDEGKFNKRFKPWLKYEKGAGASEPPPAALPTDDELDSIIDDALKGSK